VHCRKLHELVLYEAPVHSSWIGYRFVVHGFYREKNVRKEGNGLKRFSSLYRPESGQLVHSDYSIQNGKPKFTAQYYV